MPTSTVIIMTGPGTPDEPANLPYLRRIAAVELARVLRLSGLEHIVLSAPDGDGWPPEIPVQLQVDHPGQPFHFGSRLAQLITSLDQNPPIIYYFGGSSAPLLTPSILGQIQARLAGDTPLAITNNVHSSDWVAFNDVEKALPIIARCDRDNSLAWELREMAGYEVLVLSQDFPQLHLDLDTPADFALARHHPDCPPHLVTAIEDEPDLTRMPIASILDVLRTEGSQVTIIGRVGPQPWQAINQATRCWIRVFSEERGMVASGREARGEVRSMLGVLMEHVGPSAFFEHLSGMCDAAIIDSRVLMAHHGPLPPPAQRYRSDLLLWDTLDDGWLREFTYAAAQAPIPIILGGHSVVAGGLWVMSQILSNRDFKHG